MNQLLDLKNQQEFLKNKISYLKKRSKRNFWEVDPFEAHGSSLGEEDPSELKMETKRQLGVIEVDFENQEEHENRLVRNQSEKMINQVNSLQKWRKDASNSFRKDDWRDSDYLSSRQQKSIKSELLNTIRKDQNDFYYKFNDF